jgi:hypothetical protein
VRIEIALNGSPFVDTAERELTIGQWVAGLEKTIRRTLNTRLKRCELAFVHGEPLLFDGFTELLWRLMDAEMVWSVRTMLPTEGFYELRAHPGLSEHCVGMECVYVSPLDLDLFWVIGAKPFARRVVQMERKRYPVSVSALNELALDRVMGEIDVFRTGRVSAPELTERVDERALTYVPLEFGRKGEKPCETVQWLIGPDGGFYPCFSQALSEYKIRERVGELGEAWNPPKKLRMCRAKECFYGEEERVSNEAD